MGCERMHYFGGKNRSGEELAYVINKYTKNKDFYSLFTGSGGVEQHINAKNKYYNDLHFALEPLYTNLMKGWIPSVGELKEKYSLKGTDYYSDIIPLQQKLKKQLQEKNPNIDYSSPYLAILGFGCSFLGKWMVTPARDIEKRDFFQQACNGIIKKVENGLVRNLVSFSKKDYSFYNFMKGAVVYLDPPYSNTSGYSVGEFDSNKFWDFVRWLSKDNKKKNFFQFYLCIILPFALLDKNAHVIIW